MRLAVVLGVVVFAGCISAQPTDPSFPLTVSKADRDLHRMLAHPVKLDRPVVVIGGWRDLLGGSSHGIARRLRAFTGDKRILGVGIGWVGSFKQARRRVVQAVEHRFADADPHRTREVDVVGYSMGGLVARFAALPRGDAGRGNDSGRTTRLNIHRLFTISTPHQGAASAPLAFWDQLARRMKPGSAFLAGLAQARRKANFPIIAYVRLKDHMVGPTHAAPLGDTAYWVPTPLGELPHHHADADSRILADIARRLRGERPWTHAPPSPLPGK